MGILGRLFDPPGFSRPDPADAPPPRLPASIERAAHPVVAIALSVGLLMPLATFPALLTMPSGPHSEISLFDSLSRQSPVVMPALAAALLLETALMLVLIRAALRRKIFTIDRLMVVAEIRGPFSGESWREPLAAYKEVTLRRFSQKSGASWVVMLAHPRSGRAVPLYIGGEAAAAQAQHRAWAGVLKLPAVVD